MFLSVFDQILQLQFNVFCQFYNTMMIDYVCDTYGHVKKLILGVSQVLAHIEINNHKRWFKAEIFAFPN